MDGGKSRLLIAHIHVCLMPLSIIVKREQQQRPDPQRMVSSSTAAADKGPGITNLLARLVRRFANYWFGRLHRIGQHDCNEPKLGSSVCCRSDKRYLLGKIPLELFFFNSKILILF
jgi:hypothetical protein